MDSSKETLNSSSGGFSLRAKEHHHVRFRDATSTTTRQVLQIIHPPSELPRNWTTQISEAHLDFFWGGWCPKYVECSCVGSLIKCRCILVLGCRSKDDHCCWTNSFGCQIPMPLCPQQYSPDVERWTRCKSCRVDIVRKTVTDHPSKNPLNGWLTMTKRKAN